MTPEARAAYRRYRISVIEKRRHRKFHEREAAGKPPRPYKKRRSRGRRKRFHRFLTGRMAKAICDEEDRRILENFNLPTKSVDTSPDCRYPAKMKGTVDTIVVQI